MSSTDGAARQIADRLGKTLQERADGRGAAEPLHKLVADIAGVEIGKNQHIGAAGDGAEIFHLLFRDRGHHGGIGLQFAIHRQIRRPRPHQIERAPHLVDARVLSAAFGRERQHGDARRFAEQIFCAGGGGERDIGQFFRGRVGVDRAIREYERARPLLRGNSGATIRK